MALTHCDGNQSMGPPARIGCSTLIRKLRASGAELRGPRDPGRERAAPWHKMTRRPQNRDRTRTLRMRHARPERAS